MKFDTKTTLEIKKNTRLGALLFVDSYEDFKAMINAVDNVADTIGELNVLTAQKLETAKDIKAVVEASIKPIKQNFENIRNWMAQYMVENEIEKFEGQLIKSITATKPKTQKGTIAKKQIMIKRKYIDISKLSKEELIELLEEKGVKTRTKTEEVETTTEAKIRINK